MGQHIKARIGDEAGRKLLQQVTVQDGCHGSELLIHQGVLGLSMGQDGEIRHLRAGARGGGNRHQGHLLLGEISHGLAAVHGAAPTQGHQQIRLKTAKHRRSLRRQSHCGVRLDPVKIFRLLRLRQGSDALGCAVLHKIGIRHQQQPLRAEPLQHRDGPRPGINSGL